MTDDPNGWPDKIEQLGAFIAATATRVDASGRPVETPRLYTEAEVQAHSAAAAAEMREACAAWHRAQAATWPERVKIPCTGRLDSLNHAIAALRLVELPLPAPDALARMLAAERRAGMEEAAGIAEAERQRFLGVGNRSAAVGAGHAAAAIRARMEEQA
jgi:hypothetical protein